MQTHEEIFKRGFGKIREYYIAPYGLTTRYFRHPKMTQSQCKKAPIFVIKATEEMCVAAEKVRKEYEEKQPKKVTIEHFANRVINKYDCKLVYKSVSGSQYLEFKRFTLRISDHDIFNFHENVIGSKKYRHDYEIVKKAFYEDDNFGEIEQILKEITQ